MTPAEAAGLLAVAAAFDNRKPDDTAALAWSVALDGYRFVDCRDAIVGHYQATSEWIMPTHVIAAVKRIRSKRIALAGDLVPPPGSEAEQRTWLRDARRRIGDGDPAVEVYGELRPRHLPDMRILMPKASE